MKTVYSHNTDAVLDAFTKAYDSALSNYEAASALANLNHIAQATSLAVLALEEVGKMILLDGLLFARTGDERYKKYKQGHLSHRTKLDALELYPLFLNYLTTVDPRRTQNPYKQSLIIVLTELKTKRQQLAALFGENFILPDLDDLKQRGFYSHEAEGNLKSNKEAIDPNVSKAVLELAWRVTDSLKFVLGEHLDNYRERFRTLREKVNEIALKRFRKEATKIVESIFGLDSETP